MTAPAPGFPPELETAIAEMLAEHGPTGLAGGSGYSFDAKTHMCRCDRRWISESEYAVHLAAVVKEVIAQHTTTEWGVRSEHHIGDYTSPARSEEHADGMLGGYAKYGAHADKFARLVLPWQEVKA